MDELIDTICGSLTDYFVTDVSSSSIRVEHDGEEYIIQITKK